MASKSKRRGRVFRASCILAALIIAGSSFAWFTSKDEVTNRLSASADYNVVAIENFAPPKQFVPGQTVKKEEAVTNTGSVDAFVKQTISGVLEVTVEIPTTVAPNEASADEVVKYVKLEKQNEWGALEAGSTLAWAPDSSANKLGVVIGMGISGDGTVAGTPDGATGDPNDFNPDKTGLYVFRRAVQQKSGNNVNKSEDINYDYVAYYFVKGSDVGDQITEDTYYKIYGLKIDEGNINTDGYLEAGTLAAEPVYTFSKAITTYANKQEMYYDDKKDDDGERRLVVVFDGKNTIDSAIVSQAENSKSTIYDKYNDYEDKRLGATVYEKPETYSGKYPSFQKWDTAASSWQNNGDNNATGLIEYDQYDKDNAAIYTDAQKQAQWDLSNFGLTRLNELQKETRKALSGAAADSDSTDDVDDSYTALQQAARNSITAINKGVNAQTDLAAFLTEMYNLIGEASPYTGEEDSAKGGLYLKETLAPDTTEHKAGQYDWQAYMFTDEESWIAPSYTGADNKNYGNPYSGTGTEPAGFVKFDTTTDNNLIAFAPITTSANDNTYTMTADNVRENRFADPGDTGRVANTSWGKAESETGAKGYGVKWAEVTSPSASTGSVYELWNEYVYQTKRLILNRKKYELVAKALEEEGGIYPTSSTDVARSPEEAQAYLDYLDEEKAAIDKKLATAKEAYDTAAASVGSYLTRMNECQDLIDLANAEYNGYLGVDGGIVKNKNTTDKETYTMPSANYASGQNIKNVTAATVVNSGKDSKAENEFEDKLIDIFGIAVKDDSVTYEDYDLDVAHDPSDPTNKNANFTYASGYECKKDPKASAEHADKTTYSVVATKTKIDNSLTATNGVTSFSGTLNSTEQTQVKNAPYWKDVVTDNMIAKRESDVATAYGEYERLLRENAMRESQQALAASEAGISSDKVKLYVNLVNVTDKEAPSANNLWQYRGNSDLVLDGETGEIDFENSVAATDFMFGYTGILEAGETSSLLIKSVTFDEHTTQDSFRDLKFDINVTVESAQAVYNGPRIESTAAREGGITLIQPSEPSYDDAEATVAWTAGGTDTLATYNDPSHKGNTAGEDAYHIAPKTYEVVVGAAEAAPVATPIELAEPIPVVLNDGEEPTDLNYALSVKVGDEYKTYYGATKDQNTQTYYALVEGEDGTPTLTEGKGALNTSATPATVKLNVE